MKNLLLLFTLLFFYGCKNTAPEPTISQAELFEKMQGNWIPYELVNKDGQVIRGDFSPVENIFGVYAGGFQIDKNGHYFPISWFSKTQIGIKTDEKGIVTYLSNNKKLTFNGIRKLEFELQKIENNDLWLKGEDGLILKMERK